MARTRVTLRKEKNGPRKVLISSANNTLKSNCTLFGQEVASVASVGVEEIFNGTDKPWMSYESWMPENVWKIYNSMVNVYYGFYKSNQTLYRDSYKTRYSNQSLHGFSQLSDFINFCKVNEAPKELVAFLSDNDNRVCRQYKSRLDKAMDATIMFCRISINK